MKKFLLSEGDRNELRRLLSAARSAPAPTVLRDVSRKTFFEGDTYWALPPCETGLPAAEFVGDKWTSYGIKCCLFKKGVNDNEMQPLFDVVGNPIRIEVWNHYGNSEMGMVQVFKHKEGYWTNERPFGTNQGSSNSTASTTDNPSRGCGGKCIWTADANGVWQWPTGSCANTTSTTTAGPTTSASPVGSTAPPLGVPTTPSPCIAAPPCYLVCIDTSTTPAPDEYGVPVPYTRFRYDMKAGSSCPAGCKCYGLGDPCFLVNGELKSTCIGDTAATSTTTPVPGSTPAPEAYPCEEAEFIFGTVPPNIRRIAYKINGDVEPCRECSDPKADFYSPGAVPYRQHDWRKLSTVYESPCIDSPCTFAPDSEGLPLFTAFAYTDQVNVWGAVNNPAVYDNTAGLPAPRYLANWFNCELTNRNRRPSRVPPLWIYDVDDTVSDLNTSRGITFENGVYVFRTIWAEGLSCINCGRGPTVLSRDPVLFEPGGSTTTTTTGTSTTPAPCGCVRPVFCPQPFECTRTLCVPGGEVVAGSPGTTRIPSLPCFPDSTTTSTTPPTTNAPNQCIGSDGSICQCNTTTTAGPTVPCEENKCPPGMFPRYVPDTIPVDPCATCVCIPVPTTVLPPNPPLECVGNCQWNSVPVSGGGFAWRRTNPNQFCSTNYGNWQCGCVPPDGTPASCGLTAFTPCSPGNPLPTTTGAPGTTVDPNRCACCGTTPNPCAFKTCRYRSNAALRWVQVTNNCIAACPCPDPRGLPNATEECLTMALQCGSVLPPTSTPAPTTTAGPTTTTGTTTTTLGPFGCCQNPGGSCFTARQVDCQTGGRVWSGPPNVCTWTGTGSACLPPTTTPPTTTPAPTTTPGATTTLGPTTTPSPCDGPCPLAPCGCTSGGGVTCPGGSVFDCTLCLCVAPTTTTASPTTTGGVTSTAPPE